MKVFQILTAVGLLLTVMAGVGPGVAQGAIDHTTLAGSGTSGNPYQITSAQDLNSINYYNSVSGNTYWYQLENPVNISVYSNWTPIGSTGGTPFVGHFDGNGQTITGLNISGSLSWCGLFGNVASGADIKNVCLTGVSVTDTGNAGDAYIGELAGVNNGTISGSYATGAVTGTSTGISYVGGLVGDNYFGTISNSFATGSVSGTGNVGGLVGINGNGGTASITNSYATDSVSGSGDYNNDGGLVGENYFGTISNSFATGSVSGTGNVGGLVGWNCGDFHTASIGNSYATGSVSGAAGMGAYDGGLVGKNDGYYGTASITNSYATGSVSGGGALNDGGLVGKNDGDGGLASIGNSYATGSVSGAVYGGLAGYNSKDGGTAAIDSSFWDTTTTGSTVVSGGGDGSITSSSGGERTATMQTKATFTTAGWDFTPTTGTWGINDGYSYPYLNGVPPTPLPTVSVSANPSAGGTVNGDGTYNVGDQATVTATPNSGYTFVNWTGGGSAVSTAVYTFTMGATDVSLTANFTAPTQALVITGMTMNMSGSGPSTYTATGSGANWTFTVPQDTATTLDSANYTMPSVTVNMTGADTTQSPIMVWAVSGPYVPPGGAAYGTLVYTNNAWTLTPFRTQTFETAGTYVFECTVKDTADTPATLTVTVENTTTTSGGGGGNSAPGSASVSPSVGGTVALGTDASVIIPAGALQGSADVNVTIQSESSPPVAPQGYNIVGAYEFTVNGSGYIFNSPVTLTFTFPAGTTNPAVYYYDNTTSQWVLITGGTVSGDTISVTVEHFTTFAVMAQPAGINNPGGGGGGGGSSTPALAITTTSLTTSTIGQPYNQTISTNDEGTAPYTFAVTSGSLPGGLVLNASTGVISGMPTAAGTYTFTVTVKDANNNSVSENYTVTVNAAVVTPPIRPALPAVTLSDIPGNWAQANIEKLVGLGAITGYQDGTFRPNQDVTRAEFATVLVKALKLAPKTGPVFSDTQGTWAQRYISTAAAYGIVSGYDATHFGPNDFITREQMTAMVVRAAKLAPVTGNLSFKDAATIDAWAREDVITAVKDGIINGYPPPTFGGYPTFRPLAYATRAEAVTVIAGLLK